MLFVIAGITFQSLTTSLRFVVIFARISFQSLTVSLLFAIAGITFEEFMLSLVQASSSAGHSRAHGLSNALLNLIGRYQDCVMACEHPFSKRGADSLTQHSRLSFRHPCKSVCLSTCRSVCLYVYRLCVWLVPPKEGRDVLCPSPSRLESQCCH